MPEMTEDFPVKNIQNEVSAQMCFSLSVRFKIIT